MPGPDYFMIARQLSDRPAMAIFLCLCVSPPRQRDPVTFFVLFSFLKRNTFFCWAKWLIHHSPAPWILAKQLGHQMLLLLLLFFAGCSSSASINWWNDFWMSNQVETFFGDFSGGCWTLGFGWCGCTTTTRHDVQYVYFFLPLACCFVLFRVKSFGWVVSSCLFKCWNLNDNSDPSSDAIRLIWWRNG
jgi:hypothetical protein